MGEAEERRGGRNGGRGKMLMDSKGKTKFISLYFVSIILKNSTELVPEFSKVWLWVYPFLLLAL